ncbi:MAG: hypothetical protein CO113_18565 [Elusimicrobia bacterium CG_4_9_14_3_um_filter_62_55]|nr:MAG: hypothetical protein COR54_04585 [Elusimicrobia bacterium CG22_combo_CG10-13_8_21_14_all_63_91]PJA18302.1 MAG: hypothetical protein COX66_01725 [Elusimicrobia bacterium CG_4_10_14_0_2_um_filter_63_34]PJB23443.1 MAG: hypothetical protein CO113_18565 [Elusimicrobia bacterium CG_4_9_14_3_um_filter_62_55]
MPEPTPFHERTAALCKSYRWKEWAGYHAVSFYDVCHSTEYMAFRHSAGLLDVTPLFKYDVRGKDAAAFLSRIMARNVHKIKPNQVSYSCWTDGEGKILDDGTVMHLDEDFYRVTAAAPTYDWLARHVRGAAVTVEDVTAKICALAVQGPQSKNILKAVSDADIDALKFFRATAGKIDGVPVTITRTGYTGDLGYEIWTKNEHALKLYDAVYGGGRDYGIRPAGLDALDIARIEAGFILAEIDYFCAKDCLIESRKSSPYEIGLGWTVQLERGPFIGQAALAREKEEGSRWSLVGLEMDWEELESLCERYNLPPQLGSGASRAGLPIYSGGEQVGKVTSSTFSPILKKYIALASLRSEYAELGTEVQLEYTVEYERHTITARVVKTPFFDPERKKK